MQLEFTCRDAKINPDGSVVFDFSNLPEIKKYKQSTLSGRVCGIEKTIDDKYFAVVDIFHNDYFVLLPLKKKSA